MRFSTRIAFAAFALALTMPATANTVDVARSQITFVSKQMGVPVEGRFSKFSASVDYDPKKPAAARAQIEVQLGSVDTGSSEADLEVAKKSWFNVAGFPNAKFGSTSVKALAADKLEVKGTLSIKGVSRELTFPVTVKTSGGSSTFEGSFPILRLQYKIGEGPWSDTDTVADEVQIRFRIVTTANN